MQFQITLDALRTILPLTHPCDRALHEFFRQHTELGAQERQRIASSIFDVLRHRYWLRWRCASDTPRALLIGYYRWVRGWSQRELQSFLKNEALSWLSSVAEAPADAQPMEATVELPQWAIDKLRMTFSDEEIIKIGRGLNTQAPLDLRINTVQASRMDTLTQLQASGIAAEVTPYSPYGLRISGHPAIQQHPLFVAGMLEIQDEASQLVGMLLAPKRRDMVVDFCAGAGGKTLLLGALMASQGRLYAMDVSKKRLQNLKIRLKRSGLSNVHPQWIAHENDVHVKRLAGKIDRVLVDAPCSGFGTLRRNPDLKWRQSVASVAELVIKQAAILTAASKLLKPGGRLVYATCSILVEENQQQIQNFLDENANFSLCSAEEQLNVLNVPLSTGTMLQLRPDQHRTDGFFAAILERKQ